MKRVPSNLKVGAFQCGVVGFLNPDVVNFDAKIDSKSLDYALQGRFSEHSDERRLARNTPVNLPPSAAGRSGGEGWFAFH